METYDCLATMANVKCGIIQVNSKSKSYFSVLELVNNSLNIKLCEFGGGIGWSSHFDSRSISNWVERTSSTADEYLKQTSAALTGHNKDNNYIIELNEREETAELSWKKKMTDEEILFKLGSVTLTRTTCPDDIFRLCINSLSLLQVELEDIKQRNFSLDNERTQLQQKLEECYLSKQQMEIDLYSKFIQVLNEKKRKIEQLKSSKASIAKASSPPLQAPTGAVNKKRNVVPPKKNKLSPKIDDDFYLDSMEAESQDIEPIRPPPVSISKPKRRISSPDHLVAAENTDEEVDYDADTLPMETQDLLADL